MPVPPLGYWEADQTQCKGDRHGNFFYIETLSFLKHQNY